jgi:signal peptidase I
METQEDKNQNNNSKSVFKNFFIFCWDLLKILALALVIIIPFRTFVAEPFVVVGDSMELNFHNQDYLIVDRVTYRFTEPKRGDVVVLVPPKKKEDFFIKRIIAFPGETIKIAQGSVYIQNSQDKNWLLLKENYLRDNLQTIPEMTKKLGSEEYFVMGDNRMASLDSRHWGILPKDNLVGKVWLNVYSKGKLKFQLFKTPNY